MRPRLVSLIAMFAILNYGCTPAPPSVPPLLVPISATTNTASTCGGGPGAPSAAMAGNEVTLANLRNGHRLTVPGALKALPSDNIMVGVARYHAQDMANYAYLGLVAHDGEDPFRRIVCAGGAGGVQTGVIAAGYSTDPAQAYQAIIADSSASQVLYSSTVFISLSVGYSNGYWMVIVSE